MTVLIKGMEMPKDDMKNIMILADGRVFQFSGYGNPKPLGIAIPVPPHGRLIDADALLATNYGHFGAIDDMAREAIKNAPTVIPAEEG